MGNPKEAGEEDAPPPPPYTAIDSSQAPPYAAACGSSQAPPVAGASAIAGVRNRFPQCLNAYFEKKFMSKVFHLGEHAETPLYAVTMHSGWSGKPLLEMHAGPSESDPVVATAGHESRWSSGKRTVIQVFPDPASDPGGPTTSAGESSSGSGSGSGSGSPGAAKKTVHMTQKHSWTRLWHELSVEVGTGKKVRAEDFKWRRTRGEEVKELDKWGQGWKLVRLSGTAAGKNATSDGKEVVAVWTVNGSWSMNKFCKFQFLESGATGVLGDAFALVALVSGLKIWYLEFIESTAASAG
ncbi:uncharacterized protein F4812DRAFT_408631 [Daldinia caldariorum]|uniref:uncharacterized protein n=1 Tax=Daldinia caldariorum TaxID=326644 RepID=UPI0020085593|nr:uncharacterized protein F4812DRAFT_408631 [Daldinia caldariorum]KAI1472365.1 hypothetical protein F4812DRAFT_408631 [Daldinia caldariorum]